MKLSSVKKAFLTRLCARPIGTRYICCVYNLSTLHSLPSGQRFHLWGNELLSPRPLHLSNCIVNVTYSISKSANFNSLPSSDAHELNSKFIQLFCCVLCRLHPLASLSSLPVVSFVCPPTAASSVCSSSLIGKLPSFVTLPERWKREKNARNNSKFMLCASTKKRRRERLSWKTVKRPIYVEILSLCSSVGAEDVYVIAI